MACNAEDCRFQMINDDEVVISVQEESDPVNDETDENECKNNESSKVHQMLTRFLHDGNVCKAKIMADEDILDILSSTNTIDVDFDDEYEINNAAHVPTSSEMMNITS
ncbi:hypothetical protein TNCV_4277731 [Trichonephila clavipes]|nr:hypothetical protein TNCV_4277731 [Trichonephila clavipes]